MHRNQCSVEQIIAILKQYEGAARRSELGIHAAVSRSRRRCALVGR